MTQLERPQGMGKFTWIWFGQVVTMFGSGLGSFALGVWVFQKTGSVTDLMLIAFFGTLPSVLLAPIAGPLVDRWDRRKIIIGSDTLAGLCTLVIGALYFAGRLEVWQIWVLVTLIMTTSIFQGPAFSASMPLLVPKRHLGRASGMMQAGSSLSEIGAPALAGVLIGAIGLGGVMLIDFGTFLFAVFTLVVIRFPRPPQSEASLAARGSLLKEAALGLKFLRDHPGLMALLLLFSVTNISMGMIMMLMTPLILSFSTAAVLGTVMSVSSFGLFLGALLISFWGGPKQKVKAILLLTAVQGVLLILGGSRESAFFITAIAFFFLLLTPIINVSGRVLWQIKVPPDLQGRVFAARQMIAGASLPVAYLAAGPLVDRFFEPLLAADGALAGSVGRVIGVGPGRGIGFAIMAMGALMVVAAGAAAFFPRLRNVEAEVPDAIPDDEPPGPPPEPPMEPSPEPPRAAEEA